MSHDCPTCDRTLNTKQGVRMHHTRIHDEHLPNRTCKGCNTEFYDSKSRLEYCDDCDPNAGKHNGNYRDATEETECKRCDSQFEYYPSDKDGVYCPSCVEDADEFLGDPHCKDAERVEKECKYCGDEMSVLVSEIEKGNGVYCSLRCHGDWISENKTGEDHHRWKGGKVPYHGPWQRVRREALERDDHECQNCGIGPEEIGQEPDVHHIEPVREFDDPEDAHFLENLVVLCPSCHANVEHGNIPVPAFGSEQ